MHGTQIWDFTSSVFCLLERSSRHMMCALSERLFPSSLSTLPLHRCCKTFSHQNILYLLLVFCLFWNSFYWCLISSWHFTSPLNHKKKKKKCFWIYRIDVDMITKIRNLPRTWTSLATDTFVRVRTCWWPLDRISWFESRSPPVCCSSPVMRLTCDWCARCLCMLFNCAAASCQQMPEDGLRPKRCIIKVFLLQV